MAKLRHIARITAFQALTAATVSNTNDPERVFDYISSEFAPELKDTSFAKELFLGVLTEREKIDDLLQKYAPKWPIAKLASIERCALEIAAYELMEMQDTPVAVILNEAIEIAKEFGDDTAGKFINGVLSSFAKDLRKK